jgi:sialate O-acetylesterase
MKTIKICTLLFLLCPFLGKAQIRLPRLISDGMVLQRDIKVKLWGWASANEAVSLTFKGKTYQTLANQAGKWILELPPQKAGGSYELIFKGKNEVKVSDVLFGDVWICSGQSNMELPMERVRDKYAEEIAKVNYPQIRQFIVPDKYDFNQAQEDLSSGQWQAAIPKHIFAFSAVAYFFAKDIYEKYKTPIGLINSALGGSPAEAWLSEEALKKFPHYYEEAQKFKNNELIKEIESNDQKVSNTWYHTLNQNDEGLKNAWKKPDFNDSDWQEMSIPGYWADKGLSNTNGVVWFRKEINVPASMVGKPAKLLMGRIVDADSVFINGTFVGSVTYQYPPRRYEFAPTILKEGKNSIVVRVVNNSGKGGFVLDKPYELIVDNQTLDLKGKWKFKLGAKMEALPGQTFIRWKPLGLFNAMIYPLLNYGIKGVLWYQGEANTKNPAEYTDLMTSLITDWRKQWKQGDFPFLFVQLVNFMETKKEPSESAWAALRQAQLKTLSVPNTGMAVGIDIGEWNDIHPLNKEDVGKRLALQARKWAYNDKKVVYSGPIFESMQAKDGKLILNFSHVGKGLMALGGELKQFAVAGADKKFVWAKAEIKGKQVIVWSDAVPSPMVVRYAWADNPEGANLYNKEGLPASPFEAWLGNEEKK